jgi:basic amino acid/polyamine antiporter, APA family
LPIIVFDIIENNILTHFLFLLNSMNNNSNFGASVNSVQASTKNNRKLGLFLTASIMIGTMIGSGIFKKAGPMAELLGSPLLLLGVWVLAGCITLCGALSNAEVASVIPSEGGQYKYFKTIYGELVSFLYGWSILLVIQTGSIAGIAYIFSEYMISVIPLQTILTSIIHTLGADAIIITNESAVKLTTIGLILFLTSVNIRGVLLGAWTSGIFTTLKISAVLIMIILCFGYDSAQVSNITATPIHNLGGIALFGAIISALSKAFWAYDGWNSITYISSEITTPQKTIPKALIVGVSVVILLYCLLNAAFVVVLPIQEIASSSLVASDVMQKVIGPVGAIAIAVVVMVSTFGAVNGTILNSARVVQVMAKDGLLHSSLSKTHSRYSTPAVALVVQAVWSCFLVVSGTFEQLTDMLIVVSWVFYGMSAYGVIILRKTMKTTKREYAVPLYPIIPLVFTATAGVFVCTMLFNEVKQYLDGSITLLPSVSGFLIVATGLPVYWYKQRVREKVS